MSVLMKKTALVVCLCVGAAYLAVYAYPADRARRLADSAGARCRLKQSRAIREGVDR